MDSRQAYAGLQSGTAAPSGAQLRRVPHHGVGFLPPGTRYGAGRFAREARAWIADIRGRGRTPILVGGTGLFYRALVQPIFREPDLDRGRRERLEAWLEDRSLDDLRRWTARLDATTAARLDVLDRQRCLRALELALLTGRPLAWWQAHGPAEAEPLAVKTAILTLPAEEHRRRIRERAARMLDGDWPAEVAALAAAGYRQGTPAFTSIGYEAVDAWMRGEASREETLTRIVRDTWAYARRQRTWLRHQVPADVPRIDASRAADEVAADLEKAWSA